MRKTAYILAFLALLAGCSGGHGSSTPPTAPAAQSAARAPHSVGGTGTTSLTYYDQYAPYAPCNPNSPNNLVLTNGSFVVQSQSFPAGQSQRMIVSNCNFTTPQYVNVTLGTPQYGYPYIRQDGYNITIDAFGPAKVTATWTALGTSLPGTPGRSVTMTYNISAPVDFTTLWQTGNATAGGYEIASLADGQCASNSPVITGNNVSFTVLRNSDSVDDPGGSTCYRNAINPHAPGTSDIFQFTMGTHYTWYFQTVLTLHGNTGYGGHPGGGFQNDLPAILWQTHSWGEGPNAGTGPCDMLVLGNTRRAYNVGYDQYGTVNEPGNPTWQFHTCSDPAEWYIPPGPQTLAYNSANLDFPYDGEVDNWQIDVDAQLDTHSGHVTVVRNGTQIYDNPAAGICDSTARGCWWNFGPYMYVWKSSYKPPNFNEAGVTVKFNGMAFTTPVSGGVVLSRKRNP